MSIKVIGNAHLKGTSKKTGNPYDFIQVHYNGAVFGVESVAAVPCPFLYVCMDLYDV